MIRHIVLVRFDPSTSTDEIAGIFEQLRALQNSVAGMLRFEGGSNISPEGLAKGFNHGFTVDFVDAAARDAYLAHPAHQAAGGRLVASAENGLAGLIVLDIETGEA